MKTFRQILFWSHLAAGLISGLAIAVMCFTGTALAFEKELIAWAERDARRVEPPAANTVRLPLDELHRRLRAAQPAAQPTSIVVQNDPRAAIAFTAGRTVGFHVNPYTGDVRQPQSTAMGSFMQTMVTWHRYLGFSGEVSRPRGKLINGVCNLAFCALALTGLYLWMPRTWSWRGVKALAVFNWRLTGKARDFNWHNAIGLWSAPVLIVLTLTAVPISFQWGGRVINTLTGTPQPVAAAPGTSAPGGGGQASQPPVVVPPPLSGATPLSQDALLAAGQQAVPDWKTITMRIGGAAGDRGEGARGGRGAGGARGGGRGARGEAGGGRGNRGDAAPANNAVATNASTPATNVAVVASTAPAGPTTVNPAIVAAATAPTEQSTVRTPQPAGAATLPAATFTIRESSSWPRTANTTLTLDPYTGAVLRRTGYADQAPAQRVRAWTRFLHTGEALGWPGQLVAGLACLGGCFLVYTGFALSWRRFFGRKNSATEPPAN